MTHAYGWKPDLPDQRDFLSATPIPTVMPVSASLRDAMPAVYDQGNLGSCTAQAISALMQYTRRKQHLLDYTPSRLFIYYQERYLENTISSDSGAMIRDGLKAVNKWGAPKEITWPYLISKFMRKPTLKAYRLALKDRAILYARVPRTINAFKAELVHGNPIVVGISVYESFEQIGADGLGNLPAASEALLGGHAVLVVGYDDVTQRFSFRNSWGDTWGDGGYFTLPYDYMLQRGLSSDFWTIRQIGV